VSGFPDGSANAEPERNVNAPMRNRTSKGWPQDVGRTGSPGAPGTVDPSSRQLGNPQYVRHPDSSELVYDVFSATPVQQVVMHGNREVGRINQRSGLWEPTIHPDVHAGNPHHPRTGPGFVNASDAVHHLTTFHRDVAQIENVGGWRPRAGEGPNLPGH